MHLHRSAEGFYPYIDIPVVRIVWSYNGLPPQDMEGGIVTICERALTTTVIDIEHTESESYQGVAVLRVFFQPSVKVELVFSQITAVVQTILRVLPPGTFPPNILRYDASSVPIVQLGLSGQGITEEELYDLGLSFIRPRLANVEGASIPSLMAARCARCRSISTKPALRQASFGDRRFDRL